MSTDYKQIFTPCALDNGMVLKNRIIYSNGQQTFSASPLPAPDELMTTDVGIFARSGAALMNWGHFGPMGGGASPKKTAGVDKETARASGARFVADSKQHPMGSAANYDFDDPRTWNLLGQVAETAHLFETKIIVKLGASFPKGKSLNGLEEKEERLLFPRPKDDIRFTVPDFAVNDPSGLEYQMKRGNREDVPTIEELHARCATKEEINEAIEDIVDMCMRYKNAGFDGMSLRGDRWGLNACTNFREDEYNGEIEDRGRFQLELYTKIKEVCGPEFLIEVVMPGAADHGHDGQLPHGYTEEEFIRFIKMVEPVVDIVEIREENGIGYQCLAYNSEPHVHPTLDIAKHLRDAGFKKTIAVNGGYHDPEEMEQIISEGIVDLISTVRAFRSDPDFMDKLRSFGAEIPAPCIRCNKCHGARSGVSGCSVNPKDALNHRIPLVFRDPVKTKKVAVIGGGLIGMRTACFAAERGHQVTIFEKESMLGGKAAYYAPLYPQCWAINMYLDWLKDELVRRGVNDIRLNCDPDPDELKKEHFDAVIACTGSREQLPDIDGADQPDVWKNEDIYRQNVIPGQKVVIIGGSEVPTETAMYLAASGKDVTIISRSEVLMKNQYFIHGPHMGYTVIYPELGYGGNTPCWTRFDNLRTIYKARTIAVTPKSVTYEQNGVITTIDADTVVVSGGYKECLDDALKYGECSSEFYLAGDVMIDSNDLMLGNRSAFGRAMTL